MRSIVIIAVICAYIVKGMCGFANTLVFSTILSFSTNTINISPLELLVGYPSNLIIAWKERKSVRAKVSIPLSLLVIAGSIPGALVLKLGDAHMIKMIFGVVVILIGVEMFFREFYAKKSKQSSMLLVISGIVSGLLCGIFGIGALLAAYVSRTTENSSEFKGNLCVVFLVENTFRIIFYSATGILTVSVWKDAIYLLPFMLIGLLIGMRLSKLINEKLVKKVVIVVLILSGVSLLLKSTSI